MDEISFARIFKNVVRFKVTFFVLFFMSIGLGGSVVVFSKEVFQVRSSFEINFHPQSSVDLCQRVSQFPNLLFCLDASLLRRLEDVLGSDWKVSASREATLATNIPFKKEDYLAELMQANDVLTQEIYKSAQSDIGMVRKLQLEDQFSEYAAQVFLSKSLIVARIDGGESVFRFYPPRIVKIYPKTNLVMFAAAVVGLALGLLGVAFRCMVRRANE